MKSGRRWGIIKYMNDNFMKKSFFLILAAILVFSLYGCLKKSTPLTQDQVEQNQAQNINEEQKTSIPTWINGSSVISGQFADADVINLGDGKYRMYYSEEPETPGFSGRVYSAVSNDGINWTKENGIRMVWATFPSVIRTNDNKFRIYFQNQGVIKSAISSDGLSWQEERGTRIDATNPAGLALTKVASPTVIKLDDKYLMVYRGDLNQRYSADVPNNETELLLWATSVDGLTFEKQGIAFDSRNSEFKGLLDGPDLVQWDDGSIRLYFWSYRGVYHLNYQDGNFSKTASFDFSIDPSVPFPMNPPGDPTLIKISDEWFMYYGQHTKGIYYANLK